MSSRYRNARIKRRFNGKLVFESTIYPDIVQSDSDLIFTSVRGDRLDLYANKYYGDRDSYWIIAVANDLNKGSLSVPPGIKIRVPVEIDPILSEFKRINNG